MEKSKIIIKSSIKGISADFTKNLLIILLNMIVYMLCKGYRESVYTKHNIDSKVSFFEYLLKFEDITAVSILALIYLIIIIIIIITVSTIIKTFCLFYNSLRVTIFDFNNGRIIDKHFTFPLNRTVDENKFNEVIEVHVEQGVIQRLFNTGTLYIEYLTLTTVDSQLRHIEIPCVSMPFQQKNKIM